MPSLSTVSVFPLRSSFCLAYMARQIPALDNRPQMLFLEVNILWPLWIRHIFESYPYFIPLNMGDDSYPSCLSFRDNIPRLIDQLSCDSVVGLFLQFRITSFYHSCPLAESINGFLTAHTMPRLIISNREFRFEVSSDSLS